VTSLALLCRTPQTEAALAVQVYVCSVYLPLSPSRREEKKSRTRVRFGLDFSRWEREGRNGERRVPRFFASLDGGGAQRHRLAASLASLSDLLGAGKGVSALGIGGFGRDRRIMHRLL
jgi:hypothetical protein